MDEFDKILAGIQKDNSLNRNNSSQTKKASNMVNKGLLAEYCPNCGAPTTDVICEYCDSQIPPKKIVDPPASKNVAPAAKAYDEVFCSSCGEVIKAAAEFCPKCGVRQKMQETVTYYENEDDNTAATAAGVAAGFVAGAVVKNVAGDILDAFFS